MTYFPPTPFSRARSLKMAKSLAFIGYQVMRVYPRLISDLAQAEVKIPPEYYSSLAMLSALYQGLVAAIALSALAYFVERPDLYPMFIGLGLVIAFFAFVRILAYPAIVVKKRVRDIEKNFLYALRHLSIQVSGGGPVFNSMVSVAGAGYGHVSEEFKRVVKEINAGESITTALENMALRNPSIYLRRAVWQIVNSLRTGTDMGATLRVIVDQFAAEQRILLEKFGKELSPYAMMYMMLVVIFPTLGITVFMIVSSMTRIVINEMVLGAFVIGSAIAQYFFITFLKAKRPAFRW